MNFKLFILALFLVGIVASIVSGQASEKKKVVITIERQACYGRCPIYSAQIYADGTVIYNGKDFVKVIGERSHKIKKDKLERLIKAFEDIKYFSLKDEYRYNENGLTITDQPTTITSFSYKGKTKKVINYAFAPAELEKLELKIDEIADVYIYIAGR